MTFKPMLSGKAPKDLSQLTFPLLASPKLDGIRCIIHRGEPVSRNLKPIPNVHIRNALTTLPNGLDGELIVGDPKKPDTWNNTTSGVMSEYGEPDFFFYIFDWYLCDHVSMPFHVRNKMVEGFLKGLNKGRLIPVPHTLISTAEELEKYERKMVERGYEGIMVRSVDGPYKKGRSTLKEGDLLKVKRWNDSEAVVVNVKELQSNQNTPTINKLGRTARSSAKAGKVRAGKLGSLVCTAVLNKKIVEFELGTGFTEKQRKDLWKKKPIDRIVKFKYQHLSPDGKPIFPVFLGFRHPNDLS